MKRVTFELASWGLYCKRKIASRVGLSVSEQGGIPPFHRRLDVNMAQRCLKYGVV